MIILTIFAFLLIFSLIILVHELGHFIAAKKSGVKVEEFGMGLPPRIWGIKKGETLYSINWIPFGGFVKMLGVQDEGLTSKISKRSFEKQPLRKQMLIVCAGVIMNFLLAFVLLTIGFVVGIEPLIASEDEFLDAVREGQVVVESASLEDEDAFYLPRLVYLEDEDSVFYGKLADGDVLLSVDDWEVLNEEDFFAHVDEPEYNAYFEFSRNGEMIPVDLDLSAISDVLVSLLESGSPAEESGLQVGDLILEVGGQPLVKPEEIMDITANKSQDGMISYKILRDGEEMNFDVPLRDDGRIGIGVAELIPVHDNYSLYSTYTPHVLVEIQKERYGLSAPIVAVKELLRLGKMTALMFADVFGEFLTGGDVPAGVAGPVGIAQMTFVNIQNGFAAIIRFVALLSLSLGVVNILPIPALDGGRMVFIIYQAVTGHKPNPKIENWIHTGGFFLLILFLAYVTFNDVLNFF